MNCNICATNVGPFYVQHVFCEEEDREIEKKQYAVKATLTFGISSDAWPTESRNVLSTIESNIDEQQFFFSLPMVLIYLGARS